MKQINIKLGLFVFIIFVFLQAVIGQEKIILARPLFIKGIQEEQNIANELDTQMQNILKNNKNFKELDYTSEAELLSWYQEMANDSIKTIPLNLSQKLNGNMLLLIYKLSVVDGKSEDKESNTYLISLFDSSGNLISIRKWESVDLEEAIYKSIIIVDNIKAIPDLKKLIPDDTKKTITKFNLGKGLYITGNVLYLGSLGSIYFIAKGGNIPGSSNIVIPTILSTYSSGLVLCGLSNLIMRSAYSDISGKPYSLLKSGYILNYAGLALFSSGIAIASRSRSLSLNSFLMGMILGSIGEGMLVASYFIYLCDYAQIDTHFKKHKIIPVAGFTPYGEPGLALQFKF